ncbi:unnamed protein product [Sympodiomycopsis kandeliae]
MSIQANHPHHAFEEREKTKASLKAWWSSFTKAKPASTSRLTRSTSTAIRPTTSSKGKEENRVFGMPLRKSLKYASVAISMAGEDGQQYVWGYVPAIVAKIGLYLKENAVETEGVFRIAGSQKRMRELQETFDLPPRYGKDVQWDKYSIHDAASVLRRYFNQMPEPIIPLHLYNEFRNIMLKKPFDIHSAIKTYRLLIISSPPANQYLLLYVLDLLAVFARASEKNRMPASNLAVIFQPGIFSHPSHLSDSSEHKIAVEVLEFLIEHQDHFVLGLSQPPAPDTTAKDLTIVSQPVDQNADLYLEPSDDESDQEEEQRFKATEIQPSTSFQGDSQIRKAADDGQEGGAQSGNESSQIKRSKTTPTRRSRGAEVGKKATGVSSTQDSQPSRQASCRRKSVQPAETEGKEGEGATTSADVVKEETTTAPAQPESGSAAVSPPKVEDKEASPQPESQPQPQS